MNLPLLTFDDLIRGLDAFPAYQALDVFRSSVQELHTGTPIPGLTKLDERRYLLTRGGKMFLLEIFAEKNVLRFGRADDPVIQAPALGAAAGAVIGAKLSEDSLLGALAGGLFGLLVGKAISGGASGAARVFTLKFEPESRQWLAYDGGLVPWVKEQLGTGLDLFVAQPKGQ